MKKIFFLLLISGLFFCSVGFSEPYYFKECKITNAVTGNYVLNFNKNVIEVELIAIDGKVQYYSDKMELIEENKIVSEKIKSVRGKNLYYQYFLNSEAGTVTKLQFAKEGSDDIKVFNLQEKRVSFCSDIKSGWNKPEMEEAKIKKEKKEIAKAQKKLKKEQSSLINCKDNNHQKWNNCKGSYKAETGHKYIGLFIKGKIIKGTSIYPGGAKYVGDFKNNKPNGYGTFVWANGDQYFGEWKNGKSHGTGTKIWKDGREYSGMFREDKLHGEGILFYPDGKTYSGGFINNKRHGEGTFTYPDGTAYIGKFLAGKEDGLGECLNKDGTTVPCKAQGDVSKKKFVGKDTLNISIVAKKWVRISQFESNTKKGKKVMDKLESDFKVKASELCLSKGNYNVLEKRIDVLEIDETPAYGLETKLKLAINGVVECI